MAIIKLKIHVFIFLVAGVTSGSLWAQYGFGTNNPNPNSAMDIQSPDKGVLIPKISLTNSITFMATGATTTADHGMLVFNTNTVTQTAGVSNGLHGPGVYYWHYVATGFAQNGYWRQVGGQDLDGQFTQSNAVTSSTVTLTLSGDPRPVVLDVSALEEMQHGNSGGVTPTTAVIQTFTVSPTEGTLFFDTASSTLWGLADDPDNPGTPIWRRVSGLNIYNADGTLLASRTVTFNDNNLDFVTGNGNFAVRTTATETPTLYVSGGTDNRIYAGTDSFTGTVSYTASVGAGNENLDVVVEGDVKIGRYIVDQNNSVGKDGQVLARTATGMEWQSGNRLKIETLSFNTALAATTQTVSPTSKTGLILLMPSDSINHRLTLTLPGIGDGANQMPEGYTLKVRRNKPYSTTSSGTIVLNGTGGNTIGGVTQRNLNVGYQSLTLVATGTDWVVVE